LLVDGCVTEMQVFRLL